MTKLYKITNSEDQTRSMCQWGEGVTVKTSGIGGMCGKGFTHWYTDPRLAVIFNPIHGNFNLETAHLWEGEGEIIETDGLKVGCIEATTIKRVDFPIISTEQKVKFAILCALEVYNEEKFVRWAHNWLDNIDRTEATARLVAEEGWAVWAVWAVWATVWAAKAAIRALIRVADAAETAEAVARAVEAVGAVKNIDFVKIIDTILRKEI
jgi:hypothetical protein